MCVCLHIHTHVHCTYLRACERFASSVRVAAARLIGLEVATRTLAPQGITVEVGDRSIRDSGTVCGCGWVCMLVRVGGVFVG